MVVFLTIFGVLVTIKLLKIRIIILKQQRSYLMIFRWISKKRGMSFVGSITIYSYLQAIGIVDDHELECFCYKH